MRRIENDCCGCETCRGELCSLRRVEHIYCNYCKAEIDEKTFFVFGDKDYHESCVVDALVEEEIIKKERL